MRKVLWVMYGTFRMRLRWDPWWDRWYISKKNAAILMRAPDLKIIIIDGGAMTGINVECTVAVNGLKSFLHPVSGHQPDLTRPLLRAIQGGHHVSILRELPV